MATDLGSRRIYKDDSQIITLEDSYTQIKDNNTQLVADIATGMKEALDKAGVPYTEGDVYKYAAGLAVAVADDIYEILPASFSGGMGAMPVKALKIISNTSTGNVITIPFSAFAEVTWGAEQWGYAFGKAFVAAAVTETVATGFGVSAAISSGLAAIGVTGATAAAGTFVIVGLVAAPLVYDAVQGYDYYVSPEKSQSYDQDTDTYSVVTRLDHASYIDEYWSHESLQQYVTGWSGSEDFKTLSEYDRWKLATTESELTVEYDNRNQDNIFKFNQNQISEDILSRLLEKFTSGFNVEWEDGTSDTVINYFHAEAADMVSLAKSGNSTALYALVALQPYVLMEQVAEHEKLHLADYSDSYLKDRADMLYIKIQQILDPVYTTVKHWIDEDFEIKNTIHAPCKGRIVFGSEISDTLSGTNSDTEGLFESSNREDHLYGMGGNDTLNGFGGDDWLEGGEGQDTLIGGAGADTYYYLPGDGEDTITDTQTSDTDVNHIVVGAFDLSDTVIDSSYSNAAQTQWFFIDSINKITYVWDTTSHTVTISGEALFSVGDDDESKNSITIQDINSLDDLLERFGIDVNFALQGILTLDTSSPFSTENYSVSDLATSISERGIQTFNLALNQSLSADEQIVVEVSGGVESSLLYMIIDGQVRVFDDNNQIILDSVAGSTQLSCSLCQVGNLDADSSVHISASIVSTDDEGEKVTTEMLNSLDISISNSEEASLVKVEHQFYSRFEDVNANDAAVILGESGAVNYRITGSEDADQITTSGGDDQVIGMGDNDIILTKGGNDTVFDLGGSAIVKTGEGDDTVWGNSPALDYYLPEAEGFLSNSLFVRFLSSFVDNTLLGAGLLVSPSILTTEGDPNPYDSDIFSGLVVDLGEHAENLMQFNGIVYNSSETINIPDYDYYFEFSYDLATDQIHCTINYSRNTESGSFEIPVNYLNWHLTHPLDHVANLYIDGGSGNDHLVGSDGNDQIIGGLGNDRIYGLKGDDYLTGGEGSDLVSGGAGRDILLGGAGEDQLWGGAGNDQLSGGDDADQIYGQDGDDSLYGGADDDRIEGNSGADFLYGGSGNDTMIGDSPDQAQGYADYLNGEDGDDILAGGGGDDVLIGGTGNDELQGGDGDDILRGGSGADHLFGEAGNDLLYGEDGDDQLQGGEGNDALYGGSGADIIFGESGADLLYGGDADDQLVGGDGSDILRGGSGADLLIGDADDDELYGEEGDDQLQGGEGNDALFGGVGADILFGEAGTDELYGGDGDDELQGGDEQDTLYGGVGDDHLFGQDGQDELYGGVGDDYLNGGEGEDRLYGGSGADELWGYAEDDILFGDDGSDLLDGGLGDDQLEGGTGDDKLQGGEGNDQLNGGAGNDLLLGQEGDDILSGDDGADTLYGGDGNDVLYGGAGDDILLSGSGEDFLYGGAGNDIYHFSSGSGVKHLADDSGFNILVLDDMVLGGVHLSLGSLMISTGVAGDELHLDGVDYNDLVNTSPISSIEFSDGTTMAVGEVIEAVGIDYETTEEADTVTGTSARDNINALAGDDVIHAGAGNDMIDLGAGNDTADAGDGDDTVTGGDGADNVAAGAGNDHVSGNSGEDILAGDGGDDLLAGGDDNDRLYGGDDNDQLYGDLGDDALYGEAGNDLLDGGNGNDLMEGGAGDDTYFVDNDADSIVEDNNQGTDLVVSEVDYVLGDHLENLQLADKASALNATGNGLDNSLEGNSLDNVLTGLAGNDVLSGGAGNDTLDGGTGADTMLGGVGDDQYLVDNILDTVIEQGNAGTDQITATVSYALAENVENLTLSGAAALSGTGNDLDNEIYGNEQDNSLIGAAGADTLYGGAGEDTLIGGTGSDTLYGGDGDDTYSVDHAGDTVIENAGEGVDTVESTIDYTLTENVENLILDGTGDISGTGNDAANILTGNTGRNQLSGGAGNDVLYGGGGDDRLNGDSGVDTLYGEAGDDTYVIDSLDDTLVELAGQGTDTVESSVDYTLAENFENLVLAGTAETAVGNDLDNSLVGNDLANTLDGAAGADTMTGGKGDDIYLTQQNGDQIIENVNGGTDTEIRSYESTASLADYVENLTLDNGALTAIGNALDNVLIGNAEDNTLSGLNGNDVLIGGAGNDVLQGGAGDDTYFIEGDDVVTEYANEGIDTVRTANNIVLGDHLENVVLTGDGAVNATGNELDNQLVGNAGANILDGGSGGDTLIGGAGNDTYYTDSQYDQVSEMADQGTDTEIRNYETQSVLSDNIENLTLTGTVYRGNGNVLDNIIIGNDADNNLWGGAGDDTLSGHDGADQLFGAQGNDTLDGGSGNDLMTGDGGNDILSGGEGDDQLDGGAGTNLLRGGNGDDIYVYGAETGLTTIDNSDGGSDWLIFTGGITRDRLTFLRSGDDLVVRVDGNETTQVSITNWFLGESYQLAAIQPDGASGISAWTINRMFPPDNPEADGVTTPDDSEFSALWYGTSAGEQLTGSDLEELIRGYQGDDNLFGLGGNDWLLGGSGADYLDGGAGQDSLFGGTGNDQLGGAGGNDTLSGGAGDDIYVYGSNDGADTIDNSGGGTDWLIFADGITSDRLTYLQSGNDLIIRVDADEATQVTVTNWFLGADFRIDYIQPDGEYGIPADQIENMVAATGAFDSVIDGTAGSEQLVGTTGADQLNGYAGDDQLFGLGGNDELNGGEGADYLDGGAGDDRQDGGAGNDQLGGDAGNDTLVGGTGNDTYVYRPGSGADIIDNSDGGTDWLIFTDDITAERLTYLQSDDDLIVRIDGNEQTQVTVSNWFADAGNQLAYIQPASGTGIPASDINALFDDPSSGDPTEIPPASDFDNVVTGTDSAEQLVGTGGIDLLQGLAGNDQLFGLSGNDWLVAGDGADYLDGGAGDDVQLGEAGDDQLGGDAGNDTLIGGTGNDIYVYRPGSGADTINNSDGGTDWLIFTDDITADRLTYLQSDDDLIVRIDGNEQTQVTVSNWFADTGNQLAYIQPAGGYGISAANINALFGPQQSSSALFSTAAFAAAEDGANLTSLAGARADDPVDSAASLLLANGSTMTDADINQIIQEMSAYGTAEGIAMDSLADVRQNEELMTIVASGWQAA